MNDLTSNHHDYNGIDLLIWRIWSDVAEAHGGQGGKGEVHGCDVSGLQQDNSWVFSDLHTQSH